MQIHSLSKSRVQLAHAWCYLEEQQLGWHTHTYKKTVFVFQGTRNPELRLDGLFMFSTKQTKTLQITYTLHTEKSCEAQRSLVVTFASEM